MRQMDILENKVSYKHLYGKRGRFLPTFKVLAGNLIYRQEKRPRYHGRLLAYSVYCSSTCKFLNVFMNKQQTLLFYHENGLVSHDCELIHLQN